MLGRLEMNVDECIECYKSLADDVFSTPLHTFPVGMNGKIRSKFDAEKLERSIRDVMARKDVSENALFDDGVERKCRT